MKTYQKILIICALVLVSVPINIYAFIKFWAWFIVPIFHIPPLTVGQALGLFVFIKWMNPSVNTGKSHNKLWDNPTFWKRAKRAIPTNLLNGIILLTSGYIIQLFF